MSGPPDGGPSIRATALLLGPMHFHTRSSACATMEYPSVIGYKLQWDRRGNSQECVGAFSMRANFGCHRETGRGHMVMRRDWKTTALFVPALLLAGASAMAQAPQAPNPAAAMTPVTDAMLRDPPAADWLMWRRTYNGWGYSPLDQINKDNVKDLRPAWTWSLTTGATETTPIVHDGVLFIHNSAEKVQALNGATGDLIWEYKRDLPAALLADNQNYLSKRNMAIYDDKLIVATSDAHVIALDAKTGKLAWDHTTADWTKGWRYTGGPFVVNGKVIQGMTGCGNAEPGGCFITAHDAKTGAELWRVNTIAHPGDPNYDTWNGLPLESR